MRLEAPKATLSPPSVLLLLVCIVAVAAFVRFWEIDFCLPSTVCHADELRHVRIAAGIASGDLNPHFFHYPTLFFYLASGAFRVFYWLDGVSAADWHGYIPGLLLTGRSLGATAGVLSVFVLFFVGRRLGGAKVGLLAAAFLALNPLHVRDSHFMAVDTTATLFALVSLLFALRALESDRARELAASAAFAGLAAATKYNMALLAISLLAVHVLSWRRSERQWIDLLGGRLWLAAAVMIVAFLVASPYVLADWSTFKAHFAAEAQHFTVGWYAGSRPMSTTGYYATVILPHGIGIAVAALALVGVWRAVRDRSADALVLMAFFAFYVIVTLTGTTVFARYLLPLVPVLSVMAAMGVLVLAKIVPQRGESVAVIALLLAAIAQPAWGVASLGHLLRQKDTRVLAGEWIRAHARPTQLLQVGGTGGHHWVLRQSDVAGFKLQNVDSRQQPLLAGAIRAQNPIDRGAYVLTHDHPLIYSTISTELRDTLQKGARELRCFHSLKREDGVVFDYEDAFYLPLAGFSRVERPGPNICLYVLPGAPAMRKE